jgi:hypothetical protein
MDIYQSNTGPLRLTQRHVIEPSLPRVTVRFSKGGNEITGKMLAINREYIGLSHYIEFGIVDQHKVSVFNLKELSALFPEDPACTDQLKKLFTTPDPQGVTQRLKNLFKFK